ncbi:MAG TPA: phage holin family protein [Ktedonobacterales bacterium]|nr:phage holin family protein [Ktedonobacterales bacterium]
MPQLLAYIIRWVLNALALMLIAFILPGMHVTFVAALVAAIVIGAINAVLRPIIVLITLPVTLLTLGLFLLVINALLFWLASAIVPDFHVDGFLTALIASILYSILTGIITVTTRHRKEENLLASSR